MVNKGDGNGAEGLFWGYWGVEGWVLIKEMEMEVRVWFWGDFGGLDHVEGGERGGVCGRLTEGSG